jgi:hypothetical protein
MSRGLYGGERSRSVASCQNEKGEAQFQNQRKWTSGLKIGEGIDRLVKSEGKGTRTIQYPIDSFKVERSRTRTN